jgi:hypothetical protein
MKKILFLFALIVACSNHARTGTTVIANAGQAGMCADVVQETTLTCEPDSGIAGSAGFCQ